VVSGGVDRADRSASDERRRSVACEGKANLYGYYRK